MLWIASRLISEETGCDGRWVKTVLLTIPDIDAGILEGLNKRSSNRPKDVFLADGFLKTIDCEP